MIFHILHPLVLLGTPPRPAPTRMRVFRAEELTAALPHAVANKLAGGVVELEACGFTLSCYAGITSTHDLTTATALFERADGAAIAFIFAGESKALGVVSSLVFQTDFDNGKLLMTSNFAQIMRTPPRPDVDGIAFIDSKGVADLWATHAFRVRQQKGKPNHMTRGNDPLGYQVDEERLLHDYWVKKGYYRRASDGRLHLTLTGAVRAAWRGLWPWKQYTERKQRENAARVRREMAAT